MRDRIIVLAALSMAAGLNGSSVASAQGSEAARRDGTAVPVNVGLVPYVDVNSHFSKPRNNFSLDAIVGVGWRFDGAAISGVSGVVHDAGRGLQLTGVSGYVGGDMSGAQVGGVVNATRGALAGLQLSGVVNYAGQLEGAQIGIINVGGKVQGLQLGIINVADSVDGATVGLINVVGKDGRQEIDLSTSNTAAVQLATKLGTKHFYSILGVGIQRVKDKSAWMPTLGLGGSVSFAARWFLNLEALASFVNVGTEWDGGSILGQLRVAAGYKLTDRLALFAGPTLSFFRSTTGKRYSDISYTSTLATLNEGGTPVDVGLGFVAGLQAL